MKILHVGNLANIGYMISRQLRLQGIKAELLMEKNPKSIENPLNLDSSLNNSYPDWFSFYDKKSSWKTTIIKKMRDRNYNLIYAYVELPIFAYLSRKPFVAHPQGSDLREMAFSNSIRGILLRRAYRKAKAIIVSSPEQIFLVKKLKLQNGILIPFTPEHPFFKPKHIPKDDFNDKLIIFTSASSLVGEPKTPQVSEDHIATPKTAYGISKLASEHYLKLYNELNNLNYVVFRFFNIYGPYQKNGLIPSLYSRIAQNQPLTVFGKGDQIRDYVFIQDIIPFFEKAVTENIADNKIFNMGTGKGTSILDIINILSDVMNVKPEIEFKDPRPGEIGNFVADPQLLSSTFESIPSTTVEEGIKQTVEWLKNN